MKLEKKHPALCVIPLAGGAIYLAAGGSVNTLVVFGLIAACPLMHINATANAAATVTALIYLVCRAAVWLAPDFSMTIAQSWFHNIDITGLPTPVSNTGTFVLGLVSLTAAAWPVGYAFAWFYNWFLKKK